MDLAEAAEQITQGMDDVSVGRSEALPALRRQESPVPVSRILTPEEREITRLVQLYETEVDKTEELTGRGVEAITGMYRKTSKDLFSSVLDVAGDLADVEEEDEALAKICTKFFVLLTQHASTGLQEQYLLGEASVKRITSRSLEQPKHEPHKWEKPKTYQLVTREKKLPLIDRVTGKTLEETWEEVD